MNSTSGLITAIHEGPLESPCWAGFVEQLRKRCQADYAGIIFRSEHLKLSMSELATGHAIPEDLRGQYQTDFNLLAELPPGPLRPNRVYAFDEFLQKSGKAFSNTRHGRIVRVAEPGRMEGWIAIARSREDFGADAAALLSALTGHFAIALRTYATLEQARMRAGISSQAIQRLNFGWIALNLEGKVIESDPQADRIMATSTALRRSTGGKLIPESREAQAVLARLIARAAMGAAVKPTAIHLSDEPWLDMLFSPVAESQFPSQRHPVLVAYIHGEEPSAHDRHEQLAALFGLTRQEARLALAISRGRSLAEASVDLGLTLETVRLYSKRIYAKTGTRGQADLVRLVLTSVVSIV